MAAHWEFHLSVDFDTEKNAGKFETQVKDAFSGGTFELKSADWSFWQPADADDVDDCVSATGRTVGCFGACFSRLTAENIGTFLAALKELGAESIRIFFYNIDNDKSPVLFVYPIPEALYGPVGFTEYDSHEVLALSVGENTVRDLVEDDPWSCYDKLQEDMGNVLKGKDPGYTVYYTLICDGEIRDEDELVFEE